MATDVNTLLGETAFGYGRPRMIDPSRGGQQGEQPNFSEIESNSAALRGQTSCILLEAPGFIKVMRDPAKWYAAFKAFFETHTRTIEGIEISLKPEFDSHPIGGAGEIHEELVNMTRGRPEPVHGLTDKDGRPFQTLLDYWMRYGGMDPDTKHSLLATIPGIQMPADFNLKWRTASVLYFESDITNTIVNRAVICTNMFPKEQGPIEMKRDLGASKEIVTLSIPFTSISQVGTGVDMYAQQVLDSIRKTSAVPTLRPAMISAISPDVQPYAGYKEGIEALGGNAVLR